MVDKSHDKYKLPQIPNAEGADILELPHCSKFHSKRAKYKLEGMAGSEISRNLK